MSGLLAAMEVVLIRHAIAAARTQELDDAERPLTGKGVNRFRLGVRGMAHLALTFDKVLHSPWLRAVQTAELMRPVCPESFEETALLAAAPTTALLALIAEHPADASIGLVGHEPWLSELLSLLLTGGTAHGERLALKKGGVAWLHGNPREKHLVLRGFYAPRVLRRLGAASDR